MIGSFGVLSIVSGEGDRGTSLDHLDGLSTRRPALALALTVFLLAQAGVQLWVEAKMVIFDLDGALATHVDHFLLCCNLQCI